MNPFHSRGGIVGRLDIRRGLAFLALSALAVEARAQGYGPDPFRPYNSQYDAYVFGTAPGALDGIGNPSINRAGIRNANQFQSVTNQFNGAGIGGRYDQANRRYDSEYGRVYRPNARTDKNFDYDSQRAQVSELYFRYLREKDPRKRAQLMREYSKAQSQASRDLTTSPNARNSRRRSSDVAPPPPGAGGGRRASDRDADAAPPPDELPRRSNARATDDVAPRPPGESATPTHPSSGARRAPRPTGGADEATPSEVLDRATRSGDSSTAPPPPLP